MGDKTGISWTESTWNPIRGCLRVSEGCRHCYAESVAARFSQEGAPYEGLAKYVDRPGGKREARWTGKAMFVEGQLQQPLRWGRPRMVFVNSMSDLFFENIALEWVDKIVAVMALAEKHIFQVLTKRPERMRDYLSDPAMPERVLEAGARVLVDKRNIPAQLERLEERLKAPLENVWWGVSAEDQATADDRVPVLLDTPAAVRFVSYEPALGPINFRKIAIEEPHPEFPGFGHFLDAVYGRMVEHVPGVANPIVFPSPIMGRLDWIIVGGESCSPAADARRFRIEWARDVISQAKNTLTAVYVKQLGSRPTFTSGDGAEVAFHLEGKADDPSAWPFGLDVQQYPRTLT